MSDETNIDRLFDVPSPPKHTSNDGLAITPERMTNNLAVELLNDLDLGDFEVSDWEAQFIESCLSRSSFSVKQKQVIYKMAKRFNLL